MRFQQEPRSPRPRRHAAGWVLLVLLWAVAQALVLGHRIGHAGDPAGGHGAHHGHGAPERHAVGGEHDDGDAQCRLVDQAGLGEALLLAALPVPSAPTRAAAPHEAVPGPAGAHGWRPYEARAPPRG